MAEKGALHTPLCDLLGVEYPIIQAGMGEASGPTLAAAVSNAGGLGVLGVSLLNGEQIHYWIEKTKTLTDRPFGVDLLMPAAMPDISPEDLESQIPPEHLAFVRRLQEELGLAEEEGKTKWDWKLTREFMQEQIDAVLDAEAPILASGLGTPEWVVKEAHARGMKVISLVGNVKSAKRVASMGTDVIVAQGHEAGGHTGRIGTFVLVPGVIDAVRPLPVVAAGGIADGRGLVAAMALGAVGVWVGTRFVATKEASIDFIELNMTNEAYIENWRRRIVEATEEDTRVSRAYTGKPSRSITNEFILRWESEGMPALPMPLQSVLVDPLLATLRDRGDTEYLTGFAGQVSGIIKEIKSASQVVADMAEEATGILEELARR